MEIKERWIGLKKQIDQYIDHLDREIDVSKRAAAFTDVDELIWEIRARLTEISEKADTRNKEMDEIVKQARIERTIMNTLRPYALVMYMMLSEDSYANCPSMEEVD